LLTRRFFVGYVTHGTDRVYWAYLEPLLNTEERELALRWIDAIESIDMGRKADEVLTLDKDQSIGWQKDVLWEEKMGWTRIIPGEGKGK
jgi:hypothetical protein